MRAILLIVVVALCLSTQPLTHSLTLPPNTGGRINNLKVISDRTDDVSTVENILKSFAKQGMSDEERAKGIWLAAVKYRHQTTPPNEHLAADWEAHDPVKLFNVYGYCMCCCASAIIAALNREDGREARGRILNGHSVPEVSYGGGWHMFDASLLTYFPRPEGGIASVDELSKAVKDWYAANPGYRGDPKKLTDFMRVDGWNGWKKGPALLANTPFLSAGFFPARTHGWNDTMSEYDRESEVYEYGYSLGHRALFSLRPGESLTREAGNRSLHVNDDRSWDVLKQKSPESDLAYLKTFYPAYMGGVVANGTHEYRPSVARDELKLGSETYQNLRLSRLGHLQPADPNKPGVFVIEMRSPYVYLGGQIEISGRRAPGEQFSVSVSTNNGRTYTPLLVAGPTPSQEFKAYIPLQDRVSHRYAFWLKVEMNSPRPDSLSISGIRVKADIQHAPRTLPWLGKGENKITVAADTDPAIATRTVSCRITPDSAYSKNESVHTMGVSFDNLDVREEGAWWKGGSGSMTVPIQTPGDITALRFGAHIRARGAKDLIRMMASFDNGASWTEAARISGPTPGMTRYFKLTTIPAGARKALLKYELTGNNTVGIFSFRVDTDYKDPLASGFRPFRVVHRWNEGGKARTHAETILRIPFTYPIRVESVPEMASVTYEMSSSTSVPAR